MQLTDAQIQQSINRLPENIKQAVVGFDWATEILDIAHKHRLQIDDADNFRHQTLLVILGEVPAEDYEKNLVSEMNISPMVATSLVNDANDHIFQELQKRAFATHTTNSTSNNHDHMVGNDPYLEPLDHADIKDILHSEGIQLVDHHEPEVFDNELHQEVSAILAKTRTSDNPAIEKKIASQPEQKPIIKKTGNPIPINKSQPEKAIEYNEPIDDHDLKGIKGHRTNTDILPQKQKINTLSLDQRIMENHFTTNNDTIDVSPTATEKIKEEGFINHLKETTS